MATVEKDGLQGQTAVRSTDEPIPAGGVTGGEGLGTTGREAVLGGSIAVAVAGAAAIILAIVGLAGISTGIVTPVAVLVVGAALLLQGAAAAARFADATAAAGESMAGGAGGLSAEVAAGAAGIVLAILTLVNISPIPLLAVATIVFGGGLLLGSGSHAQMAGSEPEPFAGASAPRHLLREAAVASSGAEVLVGLATLVLGILAVVGNGNPMTLILVGALIVGASVLMCGAAMGSRLASILRR